VEVALFYFGFIPIFVSHLYPKAMKNILIIIILLSFTYCTSKEKNTTDILENTYLDSVIPFMSDFVNDTVMIYDVRLAENESFLNIIGKFIDSAQIYALSIIPEDTLITFHRFKKDIWHQIGSHKAISDAIFIIDFTDMDNDGNNEIIVRTPPNMNGNTWQDVFRYSTEKDSIELAGSFSTDFEIKKESRTVNVSYEGSWHMPQTKTLYKWYNQKLIPKKRIDLSLEREQDENAPRIFRYYENPFLDKDTLILKTEVPYKGKKYEEMWDNFFLTEKDESRTK